MTQPIEIAPLFKADSVTFSFYATKDGVLDGQQFVISWWPQGG